MKKIILASASPRRRELLGNIGLEFDVLISDADESSVSPLGISVPMYVQELALLKASAAAKSAGNKDALIISADTVVALDGKILGKPKDEEDAFRMLSELSGKCHSVFSGICVMNTKNAFSVCAAEETKVYFRKLSEDRIRRYIATKEPMDKAGAYGIQSLGALFVEKIEGDYFNVVGLPVIKLLEILEKEFDFDILKEKCNEI